VAVLEFKDTEGLTDSDTGTDTPESQGRLGHLEEQMGDDAPARRDGDEDRR
jgi:hypothetical protein